jgi:hypothetical protein
MSELVERYLATWNETDPALRRALIDDLYAEEAAYLDPLADVRGRNEIEATVAAVQRQFPDFVFTPIGAADAHHNLTRFGWGLGPRDGEPAVVGFDVAVTDDRGRITTVHGFLDKVPS